MIDFPHHVSGKWVMNIYAVRIRKGVCSFFLSSRVPDTGMRTAAERLSEECLKARRQSLSILYPVLYGSLTEAELLSGEYVKETKSLEKF